MSKEHANNLRGLLLQILLTLLFCACLIAYGIITRHRINSTPIITQISYARAVEITITRPIQHAIEDVAAALRVIQEEIAKQKAQDSAANAVLNSDNPYIRAAIYDHYIYEIVANYYPSINPELVRAIVYHESRYNADIVNSKTKATGLMQLLPQWHAKRGRKLGVEDLKDPYGNILTGCDYLNSLFESYSYDYALNLYAGGYPYANANRGRTSTFIKELNEIMRGLESGTIIPGGG